MRGETGKHRDTDRDTWMQKQTNGKKRMFLKINKYSQLFVLELLLAWIFLAVLTSAVCPVAPIKSFFFFSGERLHTGKTPS